MFIRQAIAEISTVYSSIDQFKTDWYQLRREAGITEDTGFASEKEFDYDPEHFLYYRARAITADTANANGDFFPFKEIESAYPTFIGKGVYLNHDNDSPDKAFGLILDALFHKSSKYVELLCALDKELAEEKHTGIVRKVSSGLINSTSMSCLCAEAECGMCHNRAKNVMELCAHMNPSSLTYVKGKKTSHGDVNYEINYGLTFTEDSLVYVPADHTARIFQVFASVNKDATIADLKQRVAELNLLLQGL